MCPNFTSAWTLVEGPIMRIQGVSRENPATRTFKPWNTQHCVYVYVWWDAHPQTWSGLACVDAGSRALLGEYFLAEHIFVAWGRSYMWPLNQPFWRQLVLSIVLMTVHWAFDWIRIGWCSSTEARCRREREGKALENGSSLGSVTHLLCRMQISWLLWTSVSLSVKW